MPATTFARPAQLHLCNNPSRSRFNREAWSPNSDSDEDETTSADSNEDADDKADAHTFDGPTESSAPVRRAPEMPSIQVRPRTVSPPRSSPLSPLAAASSSTAGAFPRPAAHPRLGMSPLAGGGAASRPAGLPKATPLARTLLNRSMMAAPAAKPKKTTKLIVPTKPFRSTFELGLNSSELARK